MSTKVQASGETGLVHKTVNETNGEVGCILRRDANERIAVEIRGQKLNRKMSRQTDSNNGQSYSQREAR